MKVKAEIKYAVDGNGALRARGSLTVDTHDEQNFMLSCSKCHVSELRISLNWKKRMHECNIYISLLSNH